MQQKSKLLKVTEASELIRDIGLDLQQKKMKKESAILRKLIAQIKRAIRQNKPSMQTPLIPKKIFSQLEHYSSFAYFNRVRITDSEVIGNGEEMVSITITF